MTIRPRLAVNGKVKKVADFTKNVQDAINSQDIVVSEDTVEVPAETAKTKEDLKGSWRKVEFKTLKGALAYFDGKEDSLLDAASRTVNTVRKQTARQSLINAAMAEMPEEERKLLVAATALKGIGDFGNDVDAIVERLRAQQK